MTDPDVPLTRMEFAALALVVKRPGEVTLQSVHRDKFLALGFIELGPNGVAVITPAGRARVAKGQ